ncbi:MAG: ArnT family glycosyltransferase [bacterium]
MNQNQNKITIIILLLITLAASVLRLVNLGEPSFWVDELDFVNAAKSMQTSGQPLLASGYPYPRAPLLTYSLMGSFKLFGVTEWSTRLPSAIFGVLSVPLLFFIGRRFFGERVGVLAALFLTFAPFAVGWSRTARMYSLFQLLFLAGFYFFYRGFEADGAKDPQARRSSLIAQLRSKWRIDVPLLLVGGFFLLLSFITHQNAGLFMLGLLVYLAACGVFGFFKKGSSVRYKYLLLFGLIAVGGLIAVALIPQARAFLEYAVSYQPKWAEVASAQNSWRIIEFFFDADKLPFYLLFLIGLASVLLRFDKAGVYSALHFVIPVLMFSFVFQYRKNDYIFHVFPLFLLLAAVGFNVVIEWVAAKARNLSSLPGVFASHPQRKWLLTGILLLWFPLSPAFRFAQKIPRLGDGFFNGAVYFNEWKHASDWLRPRLSDADVLMSTLPMTVQYYLGRADYNLNWSNGDLSREKNIRAQDGRLIDFYSGTDVIEDLDELEKLLQKYPQGWLLVDNYRFSNNVYVPEAVRLHILETMEKSYETARKTVSIYRWSFSKPVFRTK